MIHGDCSRNPAAAGDFQEAVEIDGDAGGRAAALDDQVAFGVDHGFAGDAAAAHIQLAAELNLGVDRRGAGVQRGVAPRESQSAESVGHKGDFRALLQPHIAAVFHNIGRRAARVDPQTAIGTVNRDAVRDAAGIDVQIAAGERDVRSRRPGVHRGDPALQNHHIAETVGGIGDCRAVRGLHMSAVFHNIRCRASGGDAQITAGPDRGFDGRAAVVNIHLAAGVDDGAHRGGPGVHRGVARQPHPAEGVGGEAELRALPNLHIAAVFHNVRRRAAENDQTAVVVDGRAVRRAAVVNIQTTVVVDGRIVRRAAGGDVHAAVVVDHGPVGRAAVVYGQIAAAGDRGAADCPIGINQSGIPFFDRQI